MSGVTSGVAYAIAEFAYPVSDLAGLRAVLAPDRSDRQARLVEDQGAIYYFNALGTGADDDDGIIRPNDVLPSDPGRWFKIQDGTVLDHQSLLNLQGGSISERYHLLLAQYSGLIGGASTTLHKHSHTNLDSIGTKTHPQIDSHIGSTSNPHSVTKSQVGLGAVTNDAQLKRAAGDFSSFDPKTVLATADLILIEDSADSWKKKKITHEHLTCWKAIEVIDWDGNTETVVQPRSDADLVFIGVPWPSGWLPTGLTVRVSHTGSDVWAKRAMMAENIFDPSGRPDARAWGTQTAVRVPTTCTNVWGDPDFGDPTIVAGEWTAWYRGRTDLLLPGYIDGGYFIAHVGWSNQPCTVERISGIHIQQPGVENGHIGGNRWLTNSYGIFIEDVWANSQTLNRWGLYIKTTALNYLRNNLGIGVTVPLSKIHAQLADNSADVTNPVLALFDCASGKKFNASSGKQTAARLNPDFSGQSGTAEATILDLRSVAPASQLGTRIGIDLSNSQLSNGVAEDNYWSKFNVDNFWRADGVIGAGASITLSGNYNYGFGYDIQNVSPGSNSLCSGRGARNKSTGTFIAGWDNWNAWSGGDVLIAGSPYCTITGSENKILDDQSGGSTVMGYANSVTNSPFASVFGGGNTLVDALYSTVVGVANSLTGMLSFVSGFQNVLDGIACYSIGVGNNLAGTAVFGMGGFLTMATDFSIGFGFREPSVFVDMTKITEKVTSSDCLTIEGIKKLGFPDFYGGDDDLDDMNPAGTYSGTVDKTYRVEIDAEGTPDTFRWSDTGGVSWNATGVAITGSDQTLNSGVTVKFDDTTGHTLGNYWDFDAYAHTGDLTEWKNVDGNIGTTIQNDGSLKTKNRYEAKTITDTTPYAPTATDQNIICNKATAMTVNLPAATGSGRILTIKNINTGVVTLNANGSDTIDGVSSKTINQWVSLTLLDANTGVWVII
jgi:hypothetical protein